MAISTKSDSREFLEGLRDGIPIGIGYFAVSFALGIAMKNAGLSWIDGWFMSMLNVASAGEYAATQVIASSGSYLVMAIMTFIANARYMLMSCSLSQKISPDTKMIHRFLMGYAITDELFGIAIARDHDLKPSYFYGAMLVSILPWCIGTSAGVIMGEILPAGIVSALSVALYGMFIAIFIPPAKKDRTVLVLVILSFLCSFLFTALPYVSSLSSGTRTIILTIVLAGLAAYFRPVRQEDDHNA